MQVLRHGKDIENLAQQLGIKSDSYLDFHKYRYAYLLNEISQLKTKTKLKHLLDVGPSYQTKFIRHAFPDILLDTLGTDHEQNRRDPRENHWLVDLNYIDQFDASKINPQADMILFAEVLEHLYTKPETVLAGLAQFIRVGGYLLLQTPNAAALDKRLKLLFGSNPYQRIESHRRNHFREYTRDELICIVENSGYRVIKVQLLNYLNPNQNIFQKLYLRFGPIIPQTLREGITLVAQKI